LTGAIPRGKKATEAVQAVDKANDVRKAGRNTLNIVESTKGAASPSGNSAKMVVLTDGKDHAGVKIVDKDGKTLAQFPLPIKGQRRAGSAES